MRMSFDDEDSLKEAIESRLHFNNPPCVPNTCQQIGSNMPLHESEGYEDDIIHIIPSGQNTLWRVGSSSSVKETSYRRSHGGDIQLEVCFNNNFPSKPEYTSANGM
jgi:hypothetical protein